MDTSSTWKLLKEHSRKALNWSLKEITQDKKRVQSLSLETDHIYFQFARNLVQPETIDLFRRFMEESHFNEFKEKLFCGEKINVTENERVIHTRLRNGGGPDDETGRLIRSTLEQMKKITENVHNGERLGFTKKPIRYVVNIGIGGSDLGPQFAVHALRRFSPPQAPPVFFLSTPDPAHVSEILNKVNLEETLFLVTSKSFSTKETIFLAQKIKEKYRALLESAEIKPAGIAPEKAYEAHFLGITNRANKAAAFGIAPENILRIPDGVGGRYSLWSAVGLSIALACGFDIFQRLLEGAQEMDNHFRENEVQKNIPALLALIGFWNNNFLGYPNHFVAPYAHELRELPVYLQQLEMESNGKNVSLEGKILDYETVPVLFGGVGPNCQHSYFQMLHQGSNVIPTDFIGVIEDRGETDYTDLRLSNLLAQSQGLCLGRDREKAIALMKKSGYSEEQIKQIVNHRVFPGNRPSNVLLLKNYSPESIGSLLALYENKVITQGFIWNINSFDQWGVELGKEISNSIEEAIRKRRKHELPAADEEPVTAEILNLIFGLQSGPTDSEHPKET